MLSLPDDVVVALVLLESSPQKAYIRLASHIFELDAVTQITHRSSKQDPMLNLLSDPDTASDDAVASRWGPDRSLFLPLHDLPRKSTGSLSPTSPIFGEAQLRFHPISPSSFAVAARRLQ
jgi:hypothetical protein